MAELAPGGPVYQAGTLSGNPLATAAGLAVLGEVAAGGLRGPRRPRRGFRQGSRVGGRRRWPGGRGVRRGPPGRALRGAGRGGAARAARSTTRARGRWPGATRTRGSSTPCSAAASRWRPGAYEVMFPGHGPRRGRPGPGRRGGGGGGGRSQRVVGTARRPGRTRGDGRAERRAPQINRFEDGTCTTRADWTAMPENGWPPDFPALRRGEGCTMCGPGPTRPRTACGCSKAAGPTATSAGIRCGPAMPMSSGRGGTSPSPRS